MEKSKIGGLLGICKKAGRMTVGCELTVNGIRKGTKVYLLLIACDASENTVKRAVNCCTFYHIPYETLPQSSEELGRQLGKSGSVAIIGICDGEFASAILNLMKGQGNI